jgi:hypothetical protein
MTRKTLTIAVAGLLAVSAQAIAKDVKSPDGRYAVRAEKSISLVDAAGNQILTLVADTTGDNKVEVAWSPDSQHVLVVENGNRDCSIVGAWKDQAWHKTIQLDSDEATFQKEQTKRYGRLFAEHVRLAGWLTPSEVAVDGEMTFASGAKYRYAYTLAFRQVPGRLDRGGYEEGQLIGKDYRGL